jgi:hypothetical protein
MKKTPENALLFTCEKCDFKCSKKCDYERHNSTSKHKNRTILNKNSAESADNNFMCKNCNKIYKARNSLWYHQKKCLSLLNNDDLEQDSDNVTSNLIFEVLKQNQEFKDLIIEQNKYNQELQKQMIEISKNNNTTNINNNSHNKTFNLQVFLNETCKNAMNIMDFADSIKLQLTDLENVGEYGFVNGISKIIIKSLQEMDISLRPVHCSDLKREVAYVKENGKWEKDTPDNKLIKKAIKRVAHRNIRQIPEWKKLYPDCIFSDSNKSDQYNELTIEAMGGRGDDDDGKANKIVRKIMKNVVIDKKML